MYLKVDLGGVASQAIAVVINQHINVYNDISREKCFLQSLLLIWVCYNNVTELCNVMLTHEMHQLMFD